MTIRYQYRFRDRLAFHAYHFRHSPLMVGLGAGAFLFIAYQVFQASPKEFSIAVRIITSVVLGSIVFAFLTGAFMLLTILGMISRRNKTLLTEWTVTANDEGLVSQTPYGKSELKWTIIQKLAHTRNHLFIYLSQQSAIVVPRRAIPDEAEWEAFHAFCRDRTNAAQRCESK